MSNDDKRTILFVYRGLPTGGIETLILRKSRWLIKNNYKVYILVSKVGTMHDFFKKEGVNLIIDNNVYLKPNEIFFSQFINILNNITESIEDLDDIKVIECFEPIDCYYGIVLSNLLHTKFITGVYHPSAYCSGFDLDSNESAKDLIKLLDYNKAIHFMNYDVMNSHENFYDLEIMNKFIIKLPINIKEKITKKDNKDCFEILTIGRLVDFKGYFYGLISDFDEFYNDHNNSKLIIIGDGPEKSRLIRYAKKFKAYNDGKIEFLGTIDYSKLDQYIYDASLVVGMGTSILEMASAGLPAVIAPAFKKDNYSNGFVFEDPNNVGDTKNSCTKTYKDYMDIIYNADKLKYQDIGNMCRNVVIDNYSIDSVMGQWFKMIDDSKPIVINKRLDVFKSKSEFKMLSLAGKRMIRSKLVNIKSIISR